MGIIKKLHGSELNGWTSDLNTEVYPVTAAEAVIDSTGTDMETVISRIKTSISKIQSGETLISTLATNYIQAYISAKTELEATSKLNKNEKADIPTNYKSISELLLQEGDYIFMTTCRKKGNSYLYWTDGTIWSTPIRIGSGVTSQTGIDGDGYNYIYCRTLRCVVPDIPAGLTVAKIESLLPNLGIDVSTSSRINTVEEQPYNTWFDHPLGVTKDYPFEWVAIATGNDLNWSQFGTPTLWSNFGFNGVDGDGVEYIFKLAYLNESAPTWGTTIIGKIGNTGNNYEVPVNSIATNDAYQLDDFIPQGWYDTPLQMTNTYPVLYVAMRKKSWLSDESTSKWEMFTTPVIWSNLTSSYYITADNDSFVIDDNTTDSATMKAASLTSFQVFLGYTNITDKCSFSIAELVLPNYIKVWVDLNKTFIYPNGPIGETLSEGTYYYTINAYFNNTVIASKKITFIVKDITVDGMVFKLNVTNDSWSYLDNGTVVSTNPSVISVCSIKGEEVVLLEFRLHKESNKDDFKLEVIFPDSIESFVNPYNLSISPATYSANGYDIVLYYNGVVVDSEHIDCVKNGKQGEANKISSLKYYYRCSKTKPTGNPTAEDTWAKAYTTLKAFNKNGDTTYYIWQIAYYTFDSGETSYSEWEKNEPASRMGTMSTWIGDTGIYTGLLSADLITAGTLDASLITVEGLEVGTNVSMGSNATISWSRVTNQPTILTEDDINSILNDKGFISPEDLATYLKKSEYDSDLVTTWLNKEGNDMTTYIDANTLVSSKVAANTVFAGKVKASQIDTTEAKIKTALIENLVVGTNVSMGENAKISWSNVTDKPNIDGSGSSTVTDEYITEIAKNAITTEFLNAKEITAKKVKAEDIDTTTFKITSALIEDLVVGSNVSMGDNATISWGKVQDKPNLITTAEASSLIGTEVNTLITNKGLLTTNGTFTGDCNAQTLRAGTNDNYMKFCTFAQALTESSKTTVEGGSGNITPDTMVILIKSGDSFFVLNPLDLSNGGSFDWLIENGWYDSLNDAASGDLSDTMYYSPTKKTYRAGGLGSSFINGTKYNLITTIEALYEFGSSTYHIIQAKVIKAVSFNNGVKGTSSGYYIYVPSLKVRVYENSTYDWTRYNVSGGWATINERDVPPTSALYESASGERNVDFSTTSKLYYVGNFISNTAKTRYDNISYLTDDGNDMGDSTIYKLRNLTLEDLG